MRPVAVAAGLIALAAAGLYAAVVLPAASAPARLARLSTTPLTITIAPPTVSSSTPPVASGALVTILATAEASKLDALIRPSLAQSLHTQPKLAAELGPFSASPAAQGALLVAALDAKDYPTLSAIAPVVVRLAYAASHGGGGSAVLLTIERLAHAAAATTGRLAHLSSSAAASVHLQPPPGWASRRLPGGGLDVAIAAADLGATVPAGARLAAQPAGAAAVNLAHLIASVDHARFVGAPTTYPTSVGGLRAQYVQWTTAEPSGDETTRTIFLQLAPGSSYTFTLEAPAGKWTTSFPAFDHMLASVKFG